MSPVMPIVTIEDPAVAIDLAQALLRGGIRTIEVTLRTTAALQAITAIAKQVPEILIGAGTILSPADLQAAADAGAQFAISPGTTNALLDAGLRSSIPYLPAITTSSELMNGLDAGYECFKFFPATAAGGANTLKAFAGPFPKARFCPTGGITQQTAPSFLALSNVLCVGGSWLAPKDALATRDWQRIESLAAAAAAISRN